MISALIYKGTTYWAPVQGGRVRLEPVLVCMSVISLIIFFISKFVTFYLFNAKGISKSLTFIGFTPLGSIVKSCLLISIL